MFNYSYPSNNWKNLRAFCNPLEGIIRLWRNIPLGSLELRLALDAIHRPQYGYGLYLAALQAKKLGVSSISAIEFGVGKGGGLLALENVAHKVSLKTGVSIEVFGFDLGSGLPKALDYRDEPYIWKSGYYSMDVKQLQKKLKSATLIIGDISETLPQFIENDTFPEVGFVSFDLDFYSSTSTALKIIELPYKKLLPRVLCYFDDIVGSDEELHGIFSGELLAISEFNKKHTEKKISAINGLSAKRIFKHAWNHKMYVFHAFTHKHYNTHLNSEV